MISPRRTIELKCILCGKPFKRVRACAKGKKTPKGCRSKAAVTCSPRCSTIYQNLNQGRKVQGFPF